MEPKSDIYHDFRELTSIFETNIVKIYEIQQSLANLALLNDDLEQKVNQFALNLQGWNQSLDNDG